MSMSAEAYGERTGLQVSSAEVEAARTQLFVALDEAKSASVPSTPNSLSRLYEFKVPKLGPDGTCSRFDELEDKKYDLGEVFGGRSITTTTRLMTLDVVVAHCANALAVGWLGVYQARETPRGPSLVKLAYRGAPSRAEFPLTPEFAKRSNNTAVARSGKAVVIADVAAHQRAGFGYYECDPKVKAEACLPIFKDSAVVGIIDAEHSVENYFTRQRLALLVALVLELPSMLPSGGITVA